MRKLVMFLLFGVVLFAADIEWQYSLEDAKKLAAKEDKPIVMFMNKPECRSCEFMEEQVFTDLAVKEYVMKNFIAFSANIADRNIPAEFRSKTSPVFHFIDSEGKMITDSLEGAKPASGFLRKLRKAVLAFDKR